MKDCDMIKRLNYKLSIAGLALGLLCACSTTNQPTPESTSENIASEKMSEAETMKKMADTLSQTKTTIKSEDGKIICKRTAVIGSNFKRKVCATADEWEARAAADRKTTGDLQRGGSSPGTSN